MPQTDEKAGTGKAGAGGNGDGTGLGDGDTDNGTGTGEGRVPQKGRALGMVMMEWAPAMGPVTEQMLSETGTGR